MSGSLKQRKIKFKPIRKNKPQHEQCSAMYIKRCSNLLFNCVSVRSGCDRETWTSISGLKKIMHNLFDSARYDPFHFGWIHLQHMCITVVAIAC